MSRLLQRFPGHRSTGGEIDLFGSLRRDMPIIKGEKKEEREEKKKNYHVKERSWGSFERRVAMPFHADADKVQANFRKGVLTVTVP
ncbi:Hsp20/alpha crystallin family protein [Parvibaculum sp.]|uniref:Hsp20/alpha crystallin family protein n=1 Tax=Parvibaculum sp. TaxID=2024848 RepID=UPI00320FCFD2